MASTFSPALLIEEMATGDQSGTWGTTTNNNFLLFEQAITGVLSVAQGDTTLTLTSINGTLDQARNAVIEFTGAMTGAHNVIVPSSNKVYLAKNSTTGGYAVTVKTAAGSGIAIAAGTSRWVYCDGTNVIDGLVGTLASQVASAVAITGGTITGLTSLTLASGAATPATNDAAELGSGSLSWSDLFLASGGLINWANGDAVITHSTGVLTVSTGDLRVTTAGSNAASVVTVGGTQTLTNKTLTNPTLTSPLSVANGGTGAANLNALAQVAGGQTLTGGFTNTSYNGGTVSSGTYTPAASNNNLQYLTNNGAFTMAAPAADCAINILVTNGASAGTITISGYTVGSNTGDAYTTTNTSKFIFQILRINGVSTYSWKALQ